MTASSTSGQPHVIVIGGGFGGIAAALRCRAMGAKVTLVERLERLGGRAQVFRLMDSNMTWTDCNYSTFSF